MAKFRFGGYNIVDSKISYDPSENISKNLEVELTQSHGVNLDENKFKLELGVTITDKEGLLNIEINCLGFFEFDSDLSPNERESFFNINAPAIVFPYLRAYITTLTALSGMNNPVILPTINLSRGAIEK